MRITIVTGPFLPLPPDPCGAAERLWHDLGLEFAARGHHVAFLACGSPGQAAREVVGNVTYVRRRRWQRTGRLAFDLVKDAAYSAGLMPLLPKADILVTSVFWLPLLAQARPEAGALVVTVQRYPKGQ